MNEFIFPGAVMKKSIAKELHLGYNLSEQILNAINHDLKNTIFSFIPNTAEVAFYGLWKGMEDYLKKIKIERILSWGNDITEEKLVGNDQPENPD